MAAGFELLQLANGCCQSVFLGKLTCSMNESLTPVSCSGTDLFEEGPHWDALSLLFVFFLRMDASSLNIGPVLNFLKPIPVVPMNHLWVCCCESFIPLFLSLFFLFLEWNLDASIYSETVFSTPAVLPFSAALTPQPIRHKRMPQGLVSNNMVIISHYLRACQLQHWSEIEKEKKATTKTIPTSGR